jgi:hypothetical protein
MGNSLAFSAGQSAPGRPPAVLGTNERLSDALTLSPPLVLVGSTRRAIPRSKYPAHSGDDPSFEGFL